VPGARPVPSANLCTVAETVSRPCPLWVRDTQGQAVTISGEHRDAGAWCRNNKENLGGFLEEAPQKTAGSRHAGALYWRGSEPRTSSPFPSHPASTRAYRQTPGYPEGTAGLREASASLRATQPPGAEASPVTRPLVPNGADRARKDHKLGSCWGPRVRKGPQ
jgi:hypothetical protein